MDVIVKEKILNRIKEKKVSKGSIEYDTLESLLDMNKLEFVGSDVKSLLDTIGHPGAFKPTDLVERDAIKLIRPKRGASPAVYGFITPPDNGASLVVDDKVASSLPIPQIGGSVSRAAVDDLMDNKINELKKQLLYIENEMVSIKEEMEIRERIRNEVREL